MDRETGKTRKELMPMVLHRLTVYQVVLHYQRRFMETQRRSKIRCTWDTLWSSPKPEGASAKNSIKQFPRGTQPGKSFIKEPLITFHKTGVHKVREIRSRERVSGNVSGT